MRMPTLSLSSPAPCAFEALEPRALLTAPTAAFVQATANGTALFVVVDYHADQGLDLTTLGQGDIEVSTSGHGVQVGNLFTAPSALPNGDTRAIYIVNAYDGAWNYTHDGTYNIVSPVGQVKDLNGANLQFTGVGQLYLWFPTPRVQLTSTTVEDNDWLVVVNYSDDVAIGPSTLGDADLAVVGQGLFSGITLQSTIVNSPTSITAVYRIPAPAGGWNYLNTGAYSINLNDAQVADDAGNAIPALTIGQFYLWFDKPAAEIQTTTVNTTQWLIPIKFSGRTAIDGTSIATGDIQVTAANGYSQAGTLSNLTNNGDGTFTATYVVPARSGSWDWTDNASYAVSMQTNHVHDISARFVAGGTLNTYGLWFNNPSASLVLPTSVTLHQWDITVDFNDNGTLDTSSITANSIRVESPSGPLTVSLLSTAAGPNGATRASFRLTSVGGLANGHYEIWTNPNQVHDTQNSFLIENSLASFWLWF